MAWPQGTVVVSGSLLEVTLPAFALRSCSVMPADAEIVYAAAVPPAGETELLQRRLDAARTLIATTPADAARTPAKATFDLAQRAFAQGEYSRAGYLLDSFPLARLREDR